MISHSARRWTELTAAEQRVLDAVREIGQDGWPVTIREICQRTSLQSTENVHRLLLLLIRLRLVEHHPRNPRGGYRAVSA